MKDFLSLKQLNRKEIRQVLDVAAEMRRMLSAKHKKAPHLAGRTMVHLCEEQTVFNTAASLAYGYLGGTSYDMPSPDDFIERARFLDAAGVSLICFQQDNFSLIERAASQVACQTLNGGSKFTNPLLALSVLAGIEHYCDRLGNLNVLLAGNREQSFVAELSYALNLFESALCAFTPLDATPFTQKEFVAAYKDINTAFEGIDAIIDLGLEKYSSAETYYGSKAGIKKSLMDKARVDAPLFFARSVADEKGQTVPYAFSAADRQYQDYLAVLMSVIYIFFKN